MRAKNFSIVWSVCGLALAIIAGTGCPNSGEPPADLVVTYNVPYAVGNVASGPGATTWEEQPLYLDVYEPPESKAARRALILMHGGSFLEDGKDRDRMVVWASYFARRGFVVFSIDYRLITDYPPTPPAYWELTFMPDAAHAATVDAKAAVRFVRANAASYNVDPNRIAFLGESAGAIAGAGVAITDSGDWASDGPSFPIPEFNNPGVSARVNAYVHFWGNADHVLSEIDANDPPVMICHGNEDDVFLTPFQSAERFNFFLDRIGVPNEFYEADGFGHSAWNYRLRGKSLELLTLEFLQEQLP
ncbi:MAG: alpha/beta hydrolase [Candidatus Hydrogenedentes bacterium]|nr:alpha/beta hydrolase [Candidatus Hydrogenedentota bacterium]